MGNSDIQFVGGPCGHHGPYTFYKAFKYNKNGVWRIVTLSEFFFVKMWRDSDLLCIGELQLLWIDKHTEQVLASLRLYFLPENTPEGRVDHGEDEVLAISEKVVIRVEDLITWITAEAEWSWGRLAKCEQDVKPIEDPSNEESNVPPKKPAGFSFTLQDNGLDYTDVETERKNLENGKPPKDPHVVILSFPKYCRYRAMMKRLDGVEDIYLKYKIVNALGGFYVIHPNTRVLFCRDSFEYPELEGHELLCNHLAPKLKGRPRGRRKKRSVSPASESNESESSITVCTKVEPKCTPLPLENSSTHPRRSTRCHENNENKEFVRKLGAFMKSNRTPIGRIPSLGYKELNLHEFFTRVQKLGGYDSVTANRLWKSIFDEMSGHQNSTSAATVIRRHYERFLLPYERHLRGEEYKPLPVSERRRLKYKRGNGSLSDAESSSDNASIPSTSRTVSVSEPPIETKDIIKPEGKPSSLRSVRVKPDRQKDKQVQSEKETAVNNNNNNNNEKWQPPVKTEDVKDIKPTVEKLVIKTESMTVKTELSTMITQTHPVKIEYETAKSDSQDQNAQIKYENKNIPVTISVKIETNVQADSNPVKLEECSPVKLENTSTPIIKKEPEEIKVEVIPIKTEPVTSAATPVAVKVPVSEVMSPLEGKENIPLIKSSENSLEIIEVPYKPKVAEIINVESETYKNNFIHEIKKRKLDILKEGGLEVTPVRSAPQKDGRPSVIQPPPVQLIPKPAKSETMPPPISVPLKRTHISVPQALNISQIYGSPTTPTKKPSVSNSFSYINGATPPKVVQSRSIYSYSEKTVYGNPKDIIVHAPKFVDNISRQTGGDPVDLSVNSPQKPIVEIMRIPQTSSSSPYNRDSVTKNLYKTNSSIMDGRRLGPNLEITLVGPNNKNYPNMQQKMYNYQPTSSSQQTPHKRVSTDYYAPSKITKSEENGKYRSNGSQHKPPHIDINLLMKQESLKPATSRQHQPNLKQFTNTNLPSFPPYLTQLYEQASKGLPPYLPFIDPTMYYTAAMQNLYSSNNLNSTPMVPMPTPEQLKLYAELMAHGRMPYPFQLPQDTSKLKKP